MEAEESSDMNAFAEEVESEEEYSDYDDSDSLFDN